MSDVIAKDKQIAKMVAGIFNGKNSVRRYRDRNEQNHIDILSSLNSPEEGITSYSTIGLSSYPLIKDDKEYPTRVEFVGTASNDFSLFANALATAAFNISVVDFLSCVDKNIIGDRQPYLRLILKICKKPCFNTNGNLHQLEDSVMKFKKWLETAVTVDNLWLPSVGLKCNITITLFCGTRGKSR